LGPDLHWVMTHDPGHRWDGSANMGASLAALESLGREKGYALVGCTLSGVNAIFVRGDLAGKKFRSPFTAANHYEAFKDKLYHRRKYRRCYDLFH